MTFHLNQFGVPQYPDTDARHLLVLLAAIDLLERPTVAAIADLTSHNAQQIDEEIRCLQQQFGVAIDHKGSVYHVTSWGNLLNKPGLQSLLHSDH